MNYEPITKKIEYWVNYTGTGDEYRKTHDLDCILSGGNLYADNIISLWLPLRYSLNFFDYTDWKNWKCFEKRTGVRLKHCQVFLQDLERNIAKYLPSCHNITKKLMELFEIGQTKANIMILPDREWNKMRGCRPYFDYLPHFLYSLLDTTDEELISNVKKWVTKEKLSPFFEDEIIDLDHIKDLAGTGAVYKHRPENLNLSLLLSNYVSILKKRERMLDNHDLK